MCLTGSLIFGLRELEDIPCSRINKFLKECKEDELRCIALEGAKYIVLNMKEVETQKHDGYEDDGSDSSFNEAANEAYDMHGFKEYWDKYIRAGWDINNTVSNAEHMLEVIMETCKDCPGCADSICELNRVMPKCLQTSKWEVFVSELGEAKGVHDIAQAE